jgi:hypothetical protein
MSNVAFLNGRIKNISTCMLFAASVLPFNKLGCNFIYSRVMFGDIKIKSSPVIIYILMMFRNY